LVNDQLDTQLFSMYLFQFSTCFEQPRAQHQENQLYQYNIWYMSLCVGDRFVCRSPTCTRNGQVETCRPCKFNSTNKKSFDCLISWLIMWTQQDGFH